MAHPMVGFQYASESAPSVVARPSERNALGYLVAVRCIVAKAANHITEDSHLNVPQYLLIRGQRRSLYFPLNSTLPDADCNPASKRPRAKRGKQAMCCDPQALERVLTPAISSSLRQTRSEALKEPHKMPFQEYRAALYLFPRQSRIEVGLLHQRFR